MIKLYIFSKGGPPPKAPPPKIAPLKALEGPPPLKVVNYTAKAKEALKRPFINRKPPICRPSFDMVKVNHLKISILTCRFNRHLTRSTVSTRSAIDQPRPPMLADLHSRGSPPRMFWTPPKIVFRRLFAHQKIDLSRVFENIFKYFSRKNFLRLLDFLTYL